VLLEPLGMVLGPCGVLLGCSWGVLCFLRVLLGASCGALRALGLLLVLSKWPSKHIFGGLGPLLGSLGASWDALGVLLGFLVVS
jgi:hypothetical protein